jgi:DNA-binding transcriptional LysR family regulator
LWPAPAGHNAHPAEAGGHHAAVRQVANPHRQIDMVAHQVGVSAPTMFGRQHVLPVIAEFIARYPQIRVRLLLSDGS